jgi:hypothetical protein
MSSGYYDITAQQHSTFDFHLEIHDENGDTINLAGHTARFHVRPNAMSNLLYLNISTSGVTGGGLTGEFGSTGGISGTGGILLNTGETGATGSTGGILVSVDKTTMGYVRVGSWKYSIDLNNGTTETELVNGSFVVVPKITRE